MSHDQEHDQGQGQSAAMRRAACGVRARCVVLALLVGCGGGGSADGGAAGGGGRGAGQSGSGVSGGSGGLAGAAAGARGEAGRGGRPVDAGAAGAGGLSGMGGPGGRDAGAAGASGPDAGAPDAAAARALAVKVADRALVLFGGTDNGWTRATLYTGVMAVARLTGEARFSAAAKAWAQANNWDLHPGDARFADNQCCVQTYAELALAPGANAPTAWLAGGRKAFDDMIANPNAGRVDWWWCDALFMAPPALARLGVAAGAQGSAYFDFLDTMYWDAKEFLWSPDANLFWRDKSYFNKDVYWSRGNGWVIAGLARILDVMPEARARRADYVALFQTLAKSLAPLQQSDGYWRSDLHHPEAFPNPETSGTGFFVYAMAWGVRHGVLDRATYLPVVTRGWAALVKAVDDTGAVGWVQNQGREPGPAKATDSYDFGAGAFLLAASEIAQM